MTNPFSSTLRDLAAPGGAVKYYDINALGQQVASLPVSIKIMLEQALRQRDDFEITETDVKRIASWNAKDVGGNELPWMPAANLELPRKSV